LSICRLGKFHTAGVLQLYLARKITIGARKARGIAVASDDEGIEGYGHSVDSELARPLQPHPAKDLNGAERPDRYGVKGRGLFQGADRQITTPWHQPRERTVVESTKSSARSRTAVAWAIGYAQASSS
jgi:hypothetical protein